VTADLEVIRDSGELWVRIRGWTDRRFETDQRMWSVLQRAELNLLSELLDGYTFYDNISHRVPSRDWLMRRHLGEPERDDMMAAGPRAQRAFLHGRIAAKDAIRRLLWDEGIGPMFPVELRLHGGVQGSLSIEGPHTGGVYVAVACQADVAVARASKDGPFSIALVQIGSDDLGTLGESERALGVDLPTAEWLAMVHCARSLAEQRGPIGEVAEVVVTEGRARRLRIGEQWVETRLHRDWILGWTT